jgi:flotillin
MFEFLSVLVALVVVGGAAFGAFLLVVRNLIYICGPNEALVFSGARVREGREVKGYRVIKGGRGYRIPLFETVDRMDLTNMIIELSVSNAYSKGGIPLSVHGVANLKVAGHEPALSNAIERFLGRDRADIMKIAKDTLEGNLRGVLSQLTPEQVNEDKNVFASKLLDEAEHDLSKLGLVLDTLKIQNVSDEVKYLTSTGRKQSAEVVKSARIAEAEAKAISSTRESENNKSARLIALENQRQVLRSETERRIVDARTRKSAMVAEQVGQVRAVVARATADLKVQEARVEQARRQLQADVVEPARAAMEASIAHARGGASKIIEDGRATVSVLDEMVHTWKAGGDQARDIFLMQKLQTLLTSLTNTLETVEVDRLTVLPGSNSAGVQAVRITEELKGALGVDLPKLLSVVADRGGMGSSLKTPSELP